MALRRHHYECAFEHYVRARRIPYVAVDEARKTLLPQGARPGGAESRDVEGDCLKSFDFVVYGETTNLLVDVKGRRVAERGARGAGGTAWTGTGRMDSWVTMDDVASLAGWQRLFGPGFEAVFVFVYACVSQPPDALFQEIFEFRGMWYALRAVHVDEYAREMKLRSRSWRTVHVPAAAFAKISHPFAGAGLVGDGEADPGPQFPALQPFGPLVGSTR